MQDIIQEITRFFGNLFSNIINRVTYDATNTAEQKVRDTVNQQFERQKRKPQEEDEHN
jgi:hypothetical protein